jgi:AraC-like DNA-binding protein
MDAELKVVGAAGCGPALESTPSLTGRLERFASLATGRDNRLRQQVFSAWLELSVPQRLADLHAYFEGSGCDARLALTEECYGIVIPPSASDTEKRLFDCALHVALASLRNESGTGRSLGRPRVARMLGLAQQNHGSLSLEAASRRLGQSRRHLGQIFARRTGVTFRRYSLWLRILKAAELLRDPSHPVKSIAALLGYADPSNFVREFRCVLRTTPGAFREQTQ